MAYDRARLKFCKVYADVSKLGGNVPRPPGAWLAVVTTEILLAPGYTWKSHNADKAGIVVIAILDVAHQWRQIVQVGVH